MFVLKKKYDLLEIKKLSLEVDNECLREKLKEAYEENKEYYDKVLGLENNNESLRLEKRNLEKENKELKEANEVLIKLWNDTNKKLWRNEESINQLRKLSKEIIDNKKLDRNYIASYLYELSLYISAGTKAEIKIKEEA